jgi:guanine deaminase
MVTGASVATIYYGTFVHTPELGSLEILSNTAIGVDSEGTIQFIDTEELLENILEAHNLDSNKVKIVNALDSPTKFFFPGFIDTHIHAPQYPNNGIFGNSTLLDWLTTYTFPLESSLKDLTKAKLVYDKVVSRTLNNGTTCASYYATIDPHATNTLSDVCLSKGQRAFVGKVCMNDNSPDYYFETLEECKTSTQAVVDYINKIDPTYELVAPIITPRFAPSCTSELLSWLGAYKKKHGLHCQTHISENKDEVEWVKTLFPGSSTYADVYNDHDLLDDKTILAHAIHLTDNEKDLIAKKGSGISHCPVSNSSITSGEARVRWLLDNGIPVGLGTDVSGGFSPSILHVAKQAILVSRHLAMKTENDHDKLSVEDVLYLGTVGGAKLVGLEKKLGSFAIGKKWDVQLIELDGKDSQVDVFDWQIPHPNSGDFQQKWANIVAKWLFSGDDRNSSIVWVNGKQVK